MFRGQKPRAIDSIALAEALRTLGDFLDDQGIGGDYLRRMADNVTDSDILKRIERLSGRHYNDRYRIHVANDELAEHDRLVEDVQRKAGIKNP